MKEARPPRLARMLLAVMLPERYRDQVQGDLSEGFLFRRACHGRRRAHLWYWRQLISTDLFHLRREARLHGSRLPPRQKDRTMIFDGIRADVRFALRGLRKNPLFSFTVLATLALGIGVTTAIFTAVNAVLLRPLPYPDADELVMVFRTVPRLGLARSVVSYPDFDDWRVQVTSLDEMAAYGYSETTYFGDDGAEQWTGYRVTGDLLPMLGVEPVLGRSFTDAEDRPGADPVVVLSHGLWQSRFGADPGVLGTALRFDGGDRTVVGVMPAGFAFPGPQTAYWIPLQGDLSRMERDTNFLQVIGRLAPGVAVAEAQGEIEALAAAIDSSSPAGNRDYGVFVEPRHAFVVRGVRQALLIFAGAVGLVLIIACVNVANLMLVRAATRRREIAVRAALGAGRGRLLRLLLTESTLLALLGAVIGVGVAQLLLRLMLAVESGQVARAADISLDPAALGFSLVLSVMCGIVFGAVPAWAGGTTTLGDGLKLSGHGIGLSRAARRLQHAFVTLQVALALVLLVGAALLVNSFVRLTSVDLGFEPRGVIAGRVAMPDRPRPDMRSMSEDQMMALARDWVGTRDEFVRSLLEGASALPGVEAVGASYALPLGRGSFSRTMVPEGAEWAENEAPTIGGNIVFGDYFATLGIPLLGGRMFTADDRIESPPVMLVNETLASRFWPDEDPLGKRVHIGGPDRPAVTVVGLVGDVRSGSMDAEPEPRYYRALEQVSWPDAMFVAMRSAGTAEEAAAGLRRIVTRLDARLPLTDVTTAAGLIESSVAAPRFRTLVLAIFGALATALALVGIYGVVSFVVGDRRREIGVRMAVGADGDSLVRMVLVRELVPAVAGVVLGVAGALAASRFLAGLLYGLAPHDPLTYAGVVTMMIAVVAAACYVPARRAARVPPVEVLRAE